MNLTWKQLEASCVYRMDGEEKLSRGSMKRARVTGAELLGRGELNRDRVDFEGLADGVPFKLECKTTHSASFPLNEDHFRRGQYDELVAFDGIALLLIHFNPRWLTSKRIESETYAFPVRSDMAFWRGYESGDVKSISRGDCSVHGVAVEWNRLPGCRKLSPDIVGAVEKLAAMRSKASEPLMVNTYDANGKLIQITAIMP